MNRIFVVAAVAAGAFVALVGFAGAKGARDNHAAYDFVAGEEPTVEGPDVARAPNGNTISLEGDGSFKAGPHRTASGGGTYEIDDASGQSLASGDWSVTRMKSFVSYGNGVPQGTPPDLFGGKAKFKVSLSGAGRGVLTIDCLLGSPPPGKHEGIKLVLGHGWNFTKSVSGETLFIRG